MFKNRQITQKNTKFIFIKLLVFTMLYVQYFYINAYILYF